MGQTVLARDIPWLIAQYRAGRLKLDALISERFPLERINEAIAASRTGSARRNVIVFGEAAR
jgi:Zn-dependent alcohol dehydrogenase